MVVMDEAMKEIISTTNAVMKNRPMKPDHIFSKEVVTDTA